MCPRVCERGVIGRRAPLHSSEGLDQGRDTRRMAEKVRQGVPHRGFLSRAMHASASSYRCAQKHRCRGGRLVAWLANRSIIEFPVTRLTAGETQRDHQGPLGHRRCPPPSTWYRAFSQRQRSRRDNRWWVGLAEATVSVKFSQRSLGMFATTKLAD